MSQLDADPSRSAKLVTAARVRPEAKERFVEWGGRMAFALEAVDGYTGREVIPPQSTELDEWVFVTHFASIADLKAWRDSPVRAKLLDEVKPLLEDGRITELAGDAAAQLHVENSVTEVILEQVKAGKEAQYRDWSNRIQLLQAKMPGYQGGYTQPPSSTANEWMTLLRFATIEDLNRWMASPERKALVAEAAPLVERAYLHRVNTSFPGWIPTDPATGKPPPNWKSTMLVLLGLYPIVALELAYLMKHLSGLKPAFAGFIGNLISVSVVAYVTMPPLIRWMGWWLFPKAEQEPRATLAGTALIVALYAIEIAIFWNIL